MTRPYPQLSPFALARGEATAGGGGTTAGVALPFQGALVKLTADESLLTATLLAVPWDAEIYDDGAWWVIGSPTRLTVPTGVTKVEITGAIAIVSGLVADRVIVRLKKNGDAAQTVQTAIDLDPITGGPAISFASPVLEAVAGDYFELEAFQDSGGTLSIDAAGASGEIRSYFAIKAVEATAPSTTFVGALVKLTADEIVTTATAVPWDAEVYDSGGWWVIGSPTKLTVPAGVTHVRITAGLGMNTPSADQQWHVEKNAARVDGGGWFRQDASDLAASYVTGVLEVVEGDEFTLIPTFATGAPKLRADIVGGAFFAIEAVKQAVVSGRPSLFHVRDQKADGTAGGGLTLTTWNVRTLNTELTNEISGASLASNQITLPAGTYWVEASAPSYLVNASRMRLRDTTGAATLIVGQNSNAHTSSSQMNFATLRGRFTLTATSVLELQHFAQATRAADGAGFAMTDTDEVEVYADVVIEKVA